MAKPDRARDDRRSVGSHEKMTGALGRAADWQSHKVDGNRWATSSSVDNVGKQSPAASYFVPGQANIKTGTSITDHNTGESKVVNDKPSTEYEGTAGISTKTEPTKRGGGDWPEATRNVDISKR
jgi:hypothetical protein